MSVEEADMEAIRLAKQAARERLNTLCAWAGADGDCAPASRGSLQLLADAVDMRICGPILESSLQAAPVAPAAQAGATITTGQPMSDGRWGSTEPGMPLPRGWESCDTSAGHGTAPLCHPLSWRCTEAAGEVRPPWLPQWHRGSVGVAGQSVQVLPIH